MENDDPLRTAALALLDAFRERILPGTLRRVAAWKRLGRRELPELAAELMQELALDCLQHAATIVALSDAQRHGRWMRLAERWIYRHRVRPRLPAARPAGQPSALAPERTAADLPEVPPHWVRLRNGRPNLSASAVRDGRPLTTLQREVEHLVARLGRGHDHDAFWRARLAEALTGLAADLLRLGGVLHLLPERRPRPDPERRLVRIRTLGRRFHVRPATLLVRRVVRRWTTARLDEPDVPRRLLLDAVRVWPRSTVAWLWLAEACLAAGDLGAALQAVRTHRTLPTGQRGRATLLRARVLEARGALPAACALLVRAARRWPQEARLRRALRALSG
mgnify:CR=1 FL=1